MTQEQIRNLFMEDLQSSLENMHEAYHGLHYWQHTQDFLAHYGPNASSLLRHYLDRHHERVFCYEFYHQLRTRMENHMDGNENLYLKRNIFLQSELIKTQVNSFVEITFKIRRLSGQFMPDFLLHTPGDFSNQLIVMEVKATPLLKPTDAIDDLEKLNEFIKNYEYQQGVFVAINISKTAKDALFKEISGWKKNTNPQSAQIQLYFKTNPSTRFEKYALEDI